MIKCREIQNKMKDKITQNDIIIHKTFILTN